MRARIIRTPRNSPRPSPTSSKPLFVPLSSHFFSSMSQEFIATGRRKTAVARIRMTPGTGKIEVNGKAFEDYFKTTALQNTVLQPFEVAKTVNQFDVFVNATGGGSNCHAGAARLAGARA